MALTLVTGGARSGKSTFAEKLVRELVQQNECQQERVKKRVFETEVTSAKEQGLERSQVRGIERDWGREKWQERSDEREVGNEQWEVGSDEREVGSEQWEVGSDEREVGSEKWQVRSVAEEREQGETNLRVLYIATAIPFDDEMKDRIAKHKAQRPADWRTVEQYSELADVVHEAPEPVVLLDCVTILITNLLFAAGLNEDHPAREEVERVEVEIMREIDTLLAECQRVPERKIVFVTNELGMGLVPPYPLGRIFRDIAGRVNQRIAAASDRVYLVVSGIPVPIKGGEARWGVRG